MTDSESNTLPTLGELRETGCITEEDFEAYAETITSMPNEKPFQCFQAHRQAMFGNLLPLFDKEFLEEVERKKIQSHLDQIKALGFFSEGYVDNFIIYLEVLKAPLLDADYLTNIIDKYIKPDIRVQGMRPLLKFAIGYFSSELIKNGATKRSLVKMMSKHFAMSDSEVESAINEFDVVAEYLNNNPSAYYIVDFVGLLLLYCDAFCIEDNMDIFGGHHFSVASKEKFLKAYDEYSRRIDQTYIPLIQDKFESPPYFLEKNILPELKKYIINYDSSHYERHDVNIHTGKVFSYAVLDMAPNLMDNKERLLELGWVDE